MWHRGTGAVHGQCLQPTRQLGGCDDQGACRVGPPPDRKVFPACDRQHGVNGHTDRHRAATSSPARYDNHGIRVCDCDVIAGPPAGVYNVATDPVTHMVYVTEPKGLAVINGRIDGRANQAVATVPGTGGLEARQGLA